MTSTGTGGTMTVLLAHRKAAMNGRASEGRTPQHARECLARSQAPFGRCGLHGPGGAAPHLICVDRHRAARDAGELGERLVERHGRDRYPNAIILTVVEAGILRAGGM